MGLRMASTVSTDLKPPARKERVVILGSGWAGYALARTLDPKKFERIMISPRSYFVFTPLVAGTAVGTLEFRAVMESVRRLGLDNFHQGWADDVDFERKVIRVEANTSDDLTSASSARMISLNKGGDKAVANGVGTGIVKGMQFDVPYDKLIIAVGAYSQTFGIPGVKEHANFLRDVSDARKIRMKVLQCFEKATLPTTTDDERRKLLHFAIVGGGPTGIEFAAELHDLVHEDLRGTYPALVKGGFVKITVYDVAAKVLPMFDRKLAQYATDMFRREKIEVKTEHHLTRIRDDPKLPGCLRLKITECGEDEVSAGVVVWSTGLMQNPLVEKLGGQVLRNGKTGNLVVDEHMRVLAGPPPRGSSSEVNETSQPSSASILPDVFSIGDCASVSGTGSGQPYPATAQVASQQAVYLAKRLNKNDVDTKKFKFRNWGVMTYLGSWTAIHQSSADELTGWAAWVLWRTAYLTKSMSVRNKILVPVYWFMSWVFGRDISRF
ncbi:pyridine nucleotide-disulfide oxidoreductase-domain-containing protein [Xylariaceae sp. FL0255]|nr:pyridine nucleotide-disulfide oxidoreductase-domain-containing protein [Xylariaceae sp. FL0255]